MRATISCPGDTLPSLLSATEAVCYDGVGYLQVEIIPNTGLAALTWEEVAALNGALLLCVVLAVGYNVLGKSIWGR